jgi:hypothetical protein
MKMPRWLVIGLLAASAFLLLATAGWWWVTWPQRTAREFVDCMARGGIDDAMIMMGKTLRADFAVDRQGGYADYCHEWQRRCANMPDVLLWNRDWSDVVRGCQWFEFPMEEHEEAPDVFKAERGTIDRVQYGF